MPPEVGKTKGGFTVSAFENQSDNESSTSNKTFTKLFEKFDKRMSEIENQLKSLTVHIQRQGLDNILHNRYLRFKKCKEKNLSDRWHCFKFCAEGHTAPFCPGKQGN